MERIVLHDCRFGIRLSGVGRTKPEQRGQDRRQIIIPLSEVARRLGYDKLLLKGVMVGMGIPLVPIGSALCVSPADFARLEKFIKRRGIPLALSGRRKAEPESVGA